MGGERIKERPQRVCRTGSTVAWPGEPEGSRRNRDPSNLAAE